MSINYLNELQTIYSAIDEKMGENTKIIDISKVSSLADYFIITNGKNSKQLDAIADNIDFELNKLEIHKFGIEGYGTSWILLDFGFAYIHIFDEESRELYDLERLWSDGDIVKLDK